MSNKILTLQYFLGIIAVVAMAAPLLIVVIAFAGFTETTDRAQFIVDGLRLLVQGLGVALGMRGLLLLGEIDGAPYQPQPRGVAA